MTAELRSKLAADIEALAAIERPSASPGEEQAAHWLQSRFHDLGLAAEIEPFSFNPEYWSVWAAHGLLAATSAGLALTGRRGARLAAAVSALAAASYWGELTTEFHLLRRLLPARISYNVLARLPHPRPRRVLIISAHHDAAHSGVIFHPAMFRLLSRLLGPKPDAPSPLRIPLGAMAGIAVGAVARAFGRRGRFSRRMILWGAFVNLVFAALMRSVGRSPVAPGANDDATGVAVLLALAESLTREPPRDVEVWFLSTGSEEGMLGGMQAFLRDHADELAGRRPFVLNVEAAGSGGVVYMEGEGFVRSYRYHEEAVRLAGQVAAEPEFAAVRAIAGAPFATDALIATRLGIPAVTIASLTPEGFVSHYHWPTDTPENVDLDSVELAYRFCHRLIERLLEGEEAAPVF